MIYLVQLKDRKRFTPIFSSLLREDYLKIKKHYVVKEMDLKRLAGFNLFNAPLEKYHILASGVVSEVKETVSVNVTFLEITFK